MKKAEWIVSGSGLVVVFVAACCLDSGGIYGNIAAVIVLIGLLLTTIGARRRNK